MDEEIIDEIIEEVVEEITEDMPEMKFYLGITAGRAASGFMTYKFNDVNMIRMGQVVILTGIVAMVLPLGIYGAVAGLLLVGLGCAPVYPCIIHSTPEHFGTKPSGKIHPAT